jgi:hypothetical protein
MSEEAKTKTCPVCEGQGFTTPVIREIGMPGSEGHMAITDIKRCEICDGFGYIPMVMQ